MTAGDLGGDDTLEAPVTVTSPFRRAARARAGLRPTDPVLVGRYRIERRLGEGGMGVVYAAHDPELGREVAVKVVQPHRDADERARERLLREARSMARLSHPNVVEVFDVGRCDDGVFIAMELVPGQSLSRWIGAGRRWTEIVDAFAAAGLGLAAAHDAGIIHRDFKPANVIVGGDGNVRVLDFGLARAAGAVANVPFALPPVFDRNSLTGTGSVVGTPAYMAPEQIEGGTLDARTDQFSFCVALYEALWGSRPWSADSWPRLAAAILQAHVPTPPRARVPARLLPIVRRGLARSPSDRYPDMKALVAALRSVPRRRRVPWLAGAAVVVAAAVAIAWPGAAAEPCDPTARLSEVWNESTREAVASRFEADGAPIVLAIHTHLDAGLDEFATRWGAAYRELCATTADPQALDLHMRCLGGRLSAMEAAIDVLGELEGAELRRADAIVDGLPDVDACRDAAALQQPSAGPASGAAASELAEIEREVARIDALLKAGRAPEALALAERVVAEAEQLGLEAAIARAQTVYGTALRNVGRFAEAGDAYERAFVTAMAIQDDVQAFNLASMLVFLHGVNLEDSAEARRWIEQAESMLERRTYDTRTLARFHNDVGAALLAAGDPASARDRHQRALGLLEAAFGREDLSVAHTFDMLASVAREQGRYDEAEQLLGKAIAIRSATLGASHPLVADSLNDLASSLNQQRRYAEAEDAFRRSYDILAAAYGEDNNRAMVPLSNLGLVLSQLGRDDEASATLARVLAVQERDLGVDHRETVVTVLALGNLHQRQGHRDEAERLLLRGLGSIERTRGPDHPDAALALNSLGALYATTGDSERGIEVFERVLEIRTRTLPPEHPWIAATHYNIAAVYNNLQRWDEAIVHFEESLRVARLDPEADPAPIAGHRIAFGSALRSAGQIERAIRELREALPLVEREAATDPWFERQLADGRFALARSLAVDDPRSNEAIALATSALDYYQAHTEHSREHLEQIENWLANPDARR